MKVLGEILAAILLSILATHATAQAETMVWILAGQSNMYSGFSRALTANASTVPSNVEYWCNLNDRAGLRQVTNYKKVASFGPEVEFISLISKPHPDDYHIVIKSCKGGSGMDRWQVGADLYEGLVNTVLNVVGDRVVQYKALLWAQGETDATFADTASLYQGRLVAMIQGLRLNLGCPGLPVLIELTDWKAPYIFNVDLAQINVCLSEPLVRIVPTNGMSKQSNVLHFTSRGQLQLGQRYFLVFSTLQ